MDINVDFLPARSPVFSISDSLSVSLLNISREGVALGKGRLTALSASLGEVGHSFEGTICLSWKTQTYVWGNTLMMCSLPRCCRLEGWSQGWASRSQLSRWLGDLKLNNKLPQLSTTSCCWITLNPSFSQEGRYLGSCRFPVLFLSWKHLDCLPRSPETAIKHRAGDQDNENETLTSFFGPCC